ncbi:Siderochrome-iron transporter MirB [Pleurostoma richardsiae]|uniref:Siderochrome-iron transporter MirB n=1 Tax=Pleurostoma richardsiae TaxID=41990 RepID=A0AA38RHT5_9PEZI|nr:Siderochrome-iron transporter MirB [Pleurostoma richardsiae]
MAVLNKVQIILGGKTPSDTRDISSISVPDTSGTIQMVTTNKEVGSGLREDTIASNIEKGATPSRDAQSGVKKIEAVTLAWSKKSLAVTLVLIWLLTLVNGFKSSIVASLTPFVTSNFQSHSLLAVIGIVANAITAAVYIPMAKMLDVWGRAEGFLLMTAFCVLGLILMAASHNLSTYCAAQVFYSVGFSGLAYSWDVLATDVTNLRNRGLAFAFTSSPNLITAFAGSKAAEAFYHNVSWRWGFGCWAIVLPLVALPMYGMLRYNLLKAEKRGIISMEARENHAVSRTVWYCIQELDLPGVILFAGGLTVFLLPFTLATTAPHGWKTGYIIAMIVVGFTTLILFGFYETYIAPAPFLKARFLTDRTVLGACLLDTTYQISYYCYASYFTSFLQVVNNLTVAQAGYVANTFSAVSFVFLFLAGYIIRKTGRFRWILFICVPLYIFALGLMIHFRKPNGYIGYIVMCEIFFSVAGSIFILCVQLAVLAAVDHQYVAAVLALLFVSGTVGGAVGNTVSGVIWTNTFEGALRRFLPASALPDLVTIYESLPAQLSYPVGSPERLGIQRAYGHAQAKMLAAGTAIMVLGFVWVAMMKDLNVKKMSQTKGNVL